MSFNMRWMTKRDVRSVLRIQKSSFSSTKFEKEFFLSAVASRTSPDFGADNPFVSYVCELDKKVVGYIVYKVSVLEFEKGLHTSGMLGFRDALPMSGEIVCFCVDEPHRLQGIGKHIVSSVLNRFSSVIELSLKESCPRPFLVYAVCSERDLGTHLFFKKLGFKGKNVVRGAFGKDHDGYSMSYESIPNKDSCLAHHHEEISK